MNCPRCFNPRSLSNTEHYHRDKDDPYGEVVCMICGAVFQVTLAYDSSKSIDSDIERKKQ